MLERTDSTTPEAYSIIIQGTANYGAGALTKCSVLSQSGSLYLAPDDGIARVLHWDTVNWRAVAGGPSGMSMRYRVPPRRVMAVLRQNVEIPLVGLRGGISLEPFDKVSVNVEVFSESNFLDPDPVADAYQVPDLQVHIMMEHLMHQTGSVFEALEGAFSVGTLLNIPPGARCLSSGGGIFFDSGYNLGALDHESVVPGGARGFLVPARAAYLRRNTNAASDWIALTT